MADKENLREWLISALKANNGKASIVDVCKFIWNNYKIELEESEDLFFTWQYDIRWAATQLRKERIMCAADQSPQGVWELVASQTL